MTISAAERSKIRQIFEDVTGIEAPQIIASPRKPPAVYTAAATEQMAVIGAIDVTFGVMQEAGACTMWIVSVALSSLTVTRCLQQAVARRGMWYDRAEHETPGILVDIARSYARDWGHGE